MQLSSGVASAEAAGAATSHSESVNVASYALVHDGICVRVCVYRIASCAAPSCRVASFRRVPARAETGSVGLLIMFAPPSATTERQRASRARFARFGISNYPVHQLAQLPPWLPHSTFDYRRSFNIENLDTIPCTADRGPVTFMIELGAPRPY